MRAFNMIVGLFCCVATLGFADVSVNYSGDTTFKWVGWKSRMSKRKGN